MAAARNVKRENPCCEWALRRGVSRGCCGTRAARDASRKVLGEKESRDPCFLPLLPHFLGGRRRQGWQRGRSSAARLRDLRLDRVQRLRPRAGGRRCPDLRDRPRAGLRAVRRPPVAAPGRGRRRVRYLSPDLRTQGHLMWVRSPDQAWSDCGPWPSAGDDVAPATCTDCGRRVPRAGIAAAGRCWWCWPAEYHRRLEAERKPATEGS